jgi:predicted nucleic acid-binding protein
MRGMTIPQRGCASSDEATVGGQGDVARVLLDSTVLIDALRGRPAAERLRQLRRSGDQPWVCAVTVEEIWRGHEDSEAPALGRLFRGLRVAPLGAAEGERAGRWRRDFAAQGVTLHQADCLIAAAAVGIGATLATGNPKDFPMAVAVDHWPVGR